MANERKVYPPRRARITYREFLKILKDLGKKWELSPFGRIRLVTSRFDGPSVCTCPAVVVAKAVTGKRFRNDEFDSALVSVGLHLNSSEAFANGADNDLRGCLHFGCMSVSRCRVRTRFRNDLLRATGLWKEAKKREKSA
jgi:hypothetical protein